jgi:hypothetical protein
MANKHNRLMTEAEPVSETLCSYFYKRLCLAVFALCAHFHFASCYIYIFICSFSMPHSPFVLSFKSPSWPVPVAAQFKACAVFDRSNTRIVGSNPVRGMDVCPLFFCVVLSCAGSGLATGWSPVQGVLPNVHNRVMSFRSKILNRNRPEGLIRI